MKPNFSDSRYEYRSELPFPHTYKYARPSVTVDNVVFCRLDGKVHVLLVERGIEPYKGCWALPGGFVNVIEEGGLAPDSSLEAAARRELKEETGLELTGLRQVGAYGSPTRDPRGYTITVAFCGWTQPAEVRGADDARQARWFALEALPDLAFDHQDILQDAIDQLNLNP